MMNPYVYPGTVMRTYEHKVTIPIREYEELKKRAAFGDGVVESTPKYKGISVPLEGRYDIVADYVCSVYMVQRSAVESKSRVVALMKPRHIIMYICRHFGLTVKYVGSRMDRDYSTVVVESNKIADGLKRDVGLRVEVNVLMSELWVLLNNKN